MHAISRAVAPRWQSLPVIPLLSIIVCTVGGGCGTWYRTQLLYSMMSTTVFVTVLSKNVPESCLHIVQLAVNLPLIHLIQRPHHQIFKCFWRRAVDTTSKACCFAKQNAVKNATRVRRNRGVSLHMRVVHLQDKFQKLGFTAHHSASYIEYTSIHHLRENIFFLFWWRIHGLRFWCKTVSFENCYFY